MTRQKKHVVAVAWLVSSVDLDSSDSVLLVFLSLEGPGCLKLLIPGIVLSLFCPGLQAGMAAFFFFFFCLFRGRVSYPIAQTGLNLMPQPLRF